VSSKTTAARGKCLFVRLRFAPLSLFLARGEPNPTQWPDNPKLADSLAPLRAVRLLAFCAARVHPFNFLRRICPRHLPTRVATFLASERFLIRPTSQRVGRRPLTRLLRTRGGSTREKGQRWLLFVAFNNLATWLPDFTSLCLVFDDRKPLRAFEASSAVDRMAALIESERIRREQRFHDMILLRRTSIRTTKTKTYLFDYRVSTGAPSAMKR